MERLKAAYLTLPPGLRARVPIGLEDWARARLLPRFRSTGPAAALEARLWGGFSRAALAGLAALADGSGGDARPRDAAEAALALARWLGAAGDFPAALARARQARALWPRLGGDRRQFLLEAQFLARLGRVEETRALLDARARGFDVSAELLRATSWNPVVAGPAGDPDRALAALNALLARFGLGALARRDTEAPLALDNLRGAAPAASGGGPLVTVILPFRDAAATLPAALASLAGQSHAALEVIAVDDASSDDGAGIVAALARADPRFRLIRLAVNGGGYAARNRALLEARGDFVTVHDADDWSHPEKIARHLAAHAARAVPYTISDWARASADLAFWGPWRPSPNLVTPDFSSVLFRRALVERAGAWDTARVAADREFAARLDRLHGQAPQGAFLPGAPLAFGRSGAGSLTRASASHAATLLHGLRREYREASAFWHGGLAPGEEVAAAPPFFPAPRSLRGLPEPGPAHDLLFIADFNLKGGTFHSAMHMIRAARVHGRDVALLHHRRPDLDPTRPLDEGVRRFARDEGLRLVAPGERLRARTVVLTYPALLDQAMDRFPAIDHDRLAVVVNQMAERDRAGTDVAYDPLRVRAHLAELLGSEGAWLPISERVRALMAADPRYPAPHPDTWMPLIDRESWEARTVRWRGGDPGRARPVIGRHGRDHPLKWPRDPAALRAAYCVDRPCELRFLGGGRVARARLGRRPANWHEAPFGAGDVRDFLAGLDVFLHYPDPDYVEEFGRAAMEAMAVGLPVILPPDFAPTFGDAALYAAPDGVWPLVERLWRDRAFWEARAAAGRAFVAANCGYDAFPRRLARLAAQPEPA